MGMVAPVYYTADMVRALPADGNRYEVVHGELLVTPAPRPWHEVIVGRLYSAVDAYLRAERVGHVFAGRSDISWGQDIRRTRPLRCALGAGPHARVVSDD